MGYIQGLLAIWEWMFSYLLPKLTLLLIVESVGVFATIGLLVGIIFQLRQDKKPVLYTRFVNREKGVYLQPTVSENKPQYIVVENGSSHIARRLKVDTILSFEGRTYTYSHFVPYLNPGEATKLLIAFGELVKNYPELFEIVKDGDWTKPVPLEKLKIEVKVLLRWSSFHKQEDSYEIEWGSLKSHPDIKTHPNINSWNRRGSGYIYKIHNVEKNLTPRQRRELFYGI